MKLPKDFLLNIPGSLIEVSSEKVHEVLTWLVLIRACKKQHHIPPLCWEDVQNLGENQ